MIPWTETASQVWEDFCHRTREGLRHSGADAEEVVEDLRRHIEEESRAAGLTTVTEDDLRRMLSRVGEPAAAATALPPPKKFHWGRGLLCVFGLLLGVLVPTGALVLEIFTGIAAAVLFDPIPTWFQIAAVALVPLTNLWLWLVYCFGKGAWPKPLGWAAGAAAGVATFYSLLSVPFAPFCALAVMYFGIGLIPLAPYLGLICALLLRRQVGKKLSAGALGQFWPAFGIALIALAAAQAPKFISYNGLARAESEDPAIRRGGVNTLRRFGDDKIILRTCYGMDSGDARFDVVRWLAAGDNRVQPDKAREIFYRVTGKPFNAVPPPSFYTRAGRWSEVEDEFDFAWDDALGGEAVAGCVKGLSLQASRLDAVAEPDAATVYCEWTLEFKNVSRQQREARAQIALPPGGVVSRLTLWVNGEEREAAFGGRSQVRQAYQQVAVQQRRDPVLVTTCAPDRVLMQCFPVPPDGGTMKVRVGITAPLVLATPERGAYQWPEFLERNFKLAPELKHAVWLESPQKLSAATAALAVTAEAQKFSLHGKVADGALGTALVERSGETRAVWTPARAAGRIIRQRIEETSPPPASRVVLVVDGSAGMKPWGAALAAALAHLAPGAELTCIMANDSPLPPPPPARAEPKLIAELADRLTQYRFAGGCDNLPALEQACDLAAAADHGVVVWIHDAQPVKLSAAAALRQRLERAGKPVPIFDVQLRPGPNRIAEELDGLRAFQLVPRSAGAPGDSLKKLFATLAGKTHPLEFTRESVAEAEAAGPQVSRHIERLWAKDEAARLASTRRADEATKLAAGQQLVTPYSGAVVLETQQQYATNGLTPVDPQTVPTVPEPSTWVLFLLGGAALLWHVRYTRRSRPGNS